MEQQILMGHQVGWVWFGDETSEQKMQQQRNQFFLLSSFLYVYNEMIPCITTALVENFINLLVIILMMKND